MVLLDIVWALDWSDIIAHGYLNIEAVLVPASVQFELYKWVKRKHNVQKALYATAQFHEAELITSDDHFEELPDVTFFKKCNSRKI